MLALLAQLVLVCSENDRHYATRNTFPISFGDPLNHRWNGLGLNRKSRRRYPPVA
jgi:hypothetical protein